MQTRLFPKLGYSGTISIVRDFGNFPNYAESLLIIQKTLQSWKKSEITEYFRASILGRYTTFSEPTTTHSGTYAMQCKKFHCCAAKLIAINYHL